MGVLTRGITYAATEVLDAGKLHTLVDGGSVSGIVNADVDANAGIVDTKLGQIATASKVSGAALTTLTAIPAGAGVIPAANLTSVAQKGANSDITSLTGITTPITVAQGGTGAVSILGAWASAVIGTPTQVTVDSIVLAYSAGNKSLSIKTDTANPPTTIRQEVDGSSQGSVFSPVKKNSYYLISDATAAFLIPLGG